MNSKYSNRKNINYFIVKVGRSDSDIRALFFIKIVISHLFYQVLF
jgi:hypothetical protein